jgi:hypothetical protein
LGTKESLAQENFRAHLLRNVPRRLQFELKGKRDESITVPKKTILTRSKIGSGIDSVLT